MADSVKKNFKISGSGILVIDDDGITVVCEEKGEYNLSDILAVLNDKPVKFSFSYDEEIDEPEFPKVDLETGEVLE